MRRYSRWYHLSIDRYMTGREGRDAVPSALKPFAGLYEGLKETFNPYVYFSDVKRDALQLFYGLYHLASGILKLILIPLLMVFHVLRSAFTFRTTDLLMTVPYAISWTLEAVGDVVRGAIEVATFPLALLIRIPLRTMLTSDGYQRIEASHDRTHDLLEVPITPTPGSRDSVVDLSSGLFSPPIGSSTPQLRRPSLSDTPEAVRDAEENPAAFNELRRLCPVSDVATPPSGQMQPVVERRPPMDRVHPTPSPECGFTSMPASMASSQKNDIVTLNAGPFSPDPLTPSPVKAAQDEPEAFEALQQVYPMSDSVKTDTSSTGINASCFNPTSTPAVVRLSNNLFSPGVQTPPEVTGARDQPGAFRDLHALLLPKHSEGSRRNPARTS